MGLVEEMINSVVRWHACGRGTIGSGARPSGSVRAYPTGKRLDRTWSSSRHKLWTDDPAVRPSLKEMAAPMEGLDRFAREGLDGVFQSAAGVPLRYRL